MTDELRDQLKERPTAELVAILRDYDLTEWRPEVFPVVESILQDRGVNTDAFKAARPPRGHSVEAVQLEAIASFGSPLEANLCRMALLEAGIKAWLSTEDLGGMAPPLGWASGVEVLVRRLAEAHHETFKQVYDERFAERYGALAGRGRAHAVRLLGLRHRGARLRAGAL
jgi:hypothetical protein